MSEAQPRRGYHDGRDEMNLADFPISALPRQQLSNEAGQKLDRLEFEASRYDPVTKRRIAQRVTLTTSARDGLPTPADEHVILGLLYVAKHGDNFADATVHFAPGQLFDIMGWSPNGRSYTRLRDVLRRLKSLTIRYENAWWDAAGRGYEEEVATGIISAYRIARQVSGPRTQRTALLSWVTWTQQFHDSLKNGNLKRLNLDVFFRLGSPTAQRLYRFLDKRFYNTRSFAMDLTELACGHVGLSGADNVAILKRRLQPALDELEKIGFLAPMSREDRFRKVKAGVWRVHFEAGGAVESPAPRAEGPAPEPAEPRRLPSRPVPPAPVAPPVDEPALVLAREFYLLWDPASAVQPGPRDLEQARLLLAEEAEGAGELLRLLVKVTRKEWPECRSLSGAAQKYLADARRLRDQERQRQARRQQAEAERRQSRQGQVVRQSAERGLGELWEGLSEQERRAIREQVIAGLAGGFAPEAFVQRLCLQEAARRFRQAGAGGEPGSA